MGQTSNHEITIYSLIKGNRGKCWQWRIIPKRLFQLQLVNIVRWRYCKRSSWCSYCSSRLRWRKHCSCMGIISIGWLVNKWWRCIIGKLQSSRMRHILGLNMVCIRQLLQLTSINRILGSIMCMLFRLGWWLKRSNRHLHYSFLVMEHRYHHKWLRMHWRQWHWQFR